MTKKNLAIAIALLGLIAIALILLAVRAHLPHRGEDASSTSSPIPSASAAPTSEDVAHAVAERFCEPDATKNNWQRSLTPYLTPDAWQLYSAVRPANVPCADVHDDGKPVGDQQTSTDRAYQFTASTGGPVTVTLHRDTKQDPWLASYINAGQE